MKTTDELLMLRDCKPLLLLFILLATSCVNCDTIWRRIEKNFTWGLGMGRRFSINIMNTHHPIARCGGGRSSTNACQQMPSSGPCYWHFLFGLLVLFLFLLQQAVSILCLHLKDEFWKSDHLMYQNQHKLSTIKIKQLFYFKTF